MLPNRPRKDGLPVTPRPGSRPAGRSKQDESFSSYSRESSSRHESLPSSRHMRQQRSLAPIPSPRDRSGYPPMSQSPYNSSRAYESPSGNRKEPSASLSSVMSSHVSSPLNRPKSTGNASSRTSLQDDYDLLRSGRGHNSKTKEDSRQLYQRHDREDSNATGGAGYTLWSRLATAAGTLSLDVSKAWAANITLASGEKTPPGGESQLTRAMKAYHLEKARDPSDLPEWLFEEHERRPYRRLRFIDQQKDDYHDNYEDVSESRVPTPGIRGLRDIYNSAAVSLNSNTARPNRGVVSRFGDQPTTPSKATDRLKALRDAKRQNNRFDEGFPLESTIKREGQDGQWVETSNKRPSRHVGLPSSPRG